ncbi:MAG: type II toxin-antitoxin system prevent-host-death family antitoxin [Thermomicrobiales bacterium]
MPDQEPTRTMKISEVKPTFSRLVAEDYHTKIRVLVERSGLPVAALVSIEDLERLQQLDRGWDERTQAIKRLSQAFADVPVEEAEAEVARIITERPQRRAAEAERQTA